MGYNDKTVGQSAATNTGNSWQNFLNNGLTTGQYGSTTPDPNKPNGVTPFNPWHNVTVATENGGLGVPTLDHNQGPTQTSAIGDYINGMLGSAGQNHYYDNPNNPKPAGYNPTNVDTSGSQNAISDVMSRLGITLPTQQANAPQAVNNGPSSTFTNAQNGSMSLANIIAMYAGQQSANPYGGVTTPGQSNANTNFSSNGLLGDRSNVTNALTAASQQSIADAVRNNNARFTANGGMAFGTPAAYANATTQAQGSADLANTLAQNDLGYRNLDLGAFNGENTAALGNASNNNNLFQTMMQALTSNRNNVASLFGTASSGLNNVASNEIGNRNTDLGYDTLNTNAKVNTNDMNLRSALGYDTLNSNNLNNAGQLGVAKGNLDYNTQDANNVNQFNAAGLRQNAFATQGTLDQNTNATFQNSLSNLINQLFGSYNAASQQGLPSATTSVTPNAGAQILTALPGIFQGVAKAAAAGA